MTSEFIRQSQHRRICRLAVMTLAATALAQAAILHPAAAQSGEVNVYSYREAKLLQPLLDAFTQETGIKVNTISAAAGLEQRIAKEGDKSPADLLLTVDVGRIRDAIAAGIAQPIESDILKKTVPPQYQGADNLWYAVSARARVFYVSKDRVKQDAFTYEELADPKWKGKICIRSGQHMYNNALFAAYIAHYGEAQTETWLKGLKANLAQKPSGGDRETARDIAAGKCDLGVANTYYWALMNNSDPERKPWADATRVVLPTFKNGGTHVNVSAVVLAKHAPNKANAVKFMEWLVGEKAQRIYADINNEYPVRPGVEPNTTIAGYGTLKPDTIPLAKIADHAKAASTLVDKVGFDN